jgi:hypothetical protein
MNDHETFENYIRVTDVLSPFSGLRYVDPEVLRNAAERGSRVHDICTGLCKNNEPVFMSPEWEGYIESFRKWLPGKVLGPLSERLYCDKYKITGEFDCMYVEEGGYVLVDWKTPAQPSKTWPLQGSAYSYLARMAGYDIKRIEFVKLDKTGKEPKVYAYLEHFEVFLKCLDVYKMFFHTDKEQINIEDL